jgi:hypothetical protein
MLRSVPVPFQAILWPLIGAVLILAIGRLLPAWARRLLAAAAAGASLATVWSLRGGGLERTEIAWAPLNLFRVGPALAPGDLSMPVALLLATVAVALALGIGSRQARDPWPALLLVLLAGALTTTLAANLLALAMGGALLDLALIGLALWCSEPGDGNERSEHGEHGERSESHRPLALSTAVPGLAATLLLVLCAVRLDAEVGHASFPARQIPASILLLMGVAAILRAQVFPLHARRVHGATGAAALLLPTGAGLYLLARVQAQAPVIPAEGLAALVGSLALLAGGLLAWSGGAAARRLSHQGAGGPWHGLLIHQVGMGLLFALVLPGTSPWPLLSLLLALTILVLWWDANSGAEPMPPAWLRSVGQRVEPWRQGLAERLPSLARWRDSWLATRGAVLLPALAMASLAGLPFTAGARARWPLYAALLQDGNPSLWALLVADAFLAAGLWLGLRSLFTPADRPRLSSLLSMLLLATVLVLSGLGGGEKVGWQAVRVPDVSVWGLGLLYILPWLVGIWLASLAARWRRVAPMLQSVVGLDWFYRGAGWIGRGLQGAGLWLGQVGEGAGWFGWALIILALGAIFLSGR